MFGKVQYGRNSDNAACDKQTSRWKVCLGVVPRVFDQLSVQTLPNLSRVQRHPVAGPYGVCG